MRIRLGNLLVLATLWMGQSVWGQALYDPKQVLIVVNDLVPAETGTGATGASVYVGQSYASKRGIPSSNIVHLSVPNTVPPQAYDSHIVQDAVYQTYIKAPIRNFLTQNHLTDQIRYIVTTYGVPVQSVRPSPFGGVAEYSIDSLLAAMNANTEASYVFNPYAAANPAVMRPRFANFRNRAGWQMYIVTRLDGENAMVAAGLVDKAIAAETTLQVNSGNAYLDSRQSGNFVDASILNAFNLSTAKGFPSFFNDQTITGHMIAQIQPIPPGAVFPNAAPNTLWAWGWYSAANDWPGYTFVNGAVGAQLTSYTALLIRQAQPGGWVHRWLNDGITGTWGATAEPYTTGYALADNLFNHFWSGYNFGESAYLANPALNWMMVFVGDPLYQPNVFRPAAPIRGTSQPRVVITSNPTQPGNNIYTCSIRFVVNVPQNPAGVASVQFQIEGINQGAEVTTPPYQLTLTTTDPTDNAPYPMGAKIRYGNGRIVYADPVPFLIVNSGAAGACP